MFGIKYVRCSGEVKSEAYEQADVVGKVIVTNRGYDVKIVEGTGTTISVVAYPKTFGYAFAKNSQFAIDTVLDPSGNLNITATEPHGVTFSNNSYIEIRLPKSYEKELVLKNTSAETTINCATPTIKNLYYQTESGNLTIENANLQGSLTLKLNKATFNIDENVTTQDSNVYLELTTGKFKAPNNPFNQVTVEKNTRGVVTLKECNLFTEKVETAGGQVNIDNVSYVDIASSDTNVNLKTVNGGTIILNKSGSINIETLSGNINILTVSGSIKIQNANAEAELNSTSGNIVVKNATKAILATSSNGNITVEFSEIADSYTLNNSNRKATIKSHNGAILVKGAENINAEIDASGNGSISVVMKNVYGENIINGNNGSVNVNIERTASYLLKTESVSGNVSVNLAQLAVNGYTAKELTTTEVNPPVNAANSLHVKTTGGSLKVTDTLVG